MRSYLCMAPGVMKTMKGMVC